MDEETLGRAGGGENIGPQFSGRQIGVVQPFSQIMGFLDRGRDAARKTRASICPTLGCFSKVKLGSRLEGRKETKSPSRAQGPAGDRSPSGPR